MDFGIPSNLHPNIRRSSNAYFMIIGLGLISLFFNWEQIENLPFSKTAQIGITVCSFAVNIIIAWLIRLGVNWIRYPLLGINVLGSLYSLSVLFIVYKENIWLGILDTVSIGLTLYAAIILFEPSTALWYKQKKWGDFYEEPNAEE